MISMTFDELREPLTPIELAELTDAVQHVLTPQGKKLMRRLAFQYQQKIDNDRNENNQAR